MRRYQSFISPTLLVLFGTLALAQPVPRREGHQERHGQEPRQPREAAPGHHQEGPERHPDRREARPQLVQKERPRLLGHNASGPRFMERHPEPIRHARTLQPQAARIDPQSAVRTREEARTWQTRGAWRQDAWQPHPSWREHRANRWEAEHRTWSQRGGYGGYSIPEAQFTPTFGDKNGFRLGSRPGIYGGYPRFSCRGFWFQIVDPWPELWMDDWYLNDEVYIDYRFDGYYLFNRQHPGVGMALTVSI